MKCHGVPAVASDGVAAKAAPTSAAASSMRGKDFTGMAPGEVVSGFPMGGSFPRNAVPFDARAVQPLPAVVIAVIRAMVLIQKLVRHQGLIGDECVADVRRNGSR